MVSEKLLQILVCPRTRAPLVLDGDWLVSTDAETRLRYPVRNDIPVMLIDEADTVPEDEWIEIMARHGR